MNQFPSFGSPESTRDSRLRPKLDEYKVLAKPRKSKKQSKRIKGIKGFPGRCQGPFWINSSYRNVTPTHVCCGRSHKFKTSKNKKDVKGKTEKPEEDEEVTTLEKKFEANKEMQKVQRAKNMDGQEYDITVENLLVSSTVLVY